MRDKRLFAPTDTYAWRWVSLVHQLNMRKAITDQTQVLLMIGTAVFLVLCPAEMRTVWGFDLRNLAWVAVFGAWAGTVANSWRAERAIDREIDQWPKPSQPPTE